MTSNPAWWRLPAILIGALFGLVVVTGGIIFLMLGKPPATPLKSERSATPGAAGAPQRRETVPSPMTPDPAGRQASERPRYESTPPQHVLEPDPPRSASGGGAPSAVPSAVSGTFPAAETPGVSSPAPGHLSGNLADAQKAAGCARGFSGILCREKARVTWCAQPGHDKDADCQQAEKVEPR